MRNRALIATLWRCGLRLGEALALRPKDFDPDQGTLVVQRGKGGRRRVVGVDAGTAALVGRWLEVRRKRGIGGRTLFCSLRGRPMDQSYVRHMLPRLARKAGVERRVHAHGLRHAFAVDMVRSGAPLYVVRDALGHSSVATTQIYLSPCRGARGGRRDAQPRVGRPPRGVSGDLSEGTGSPGAVLSPFRRAVRRLQVRLSRPITPLSSREEP